MMASTVAARLSSATSRAATRAPSAASRTATARPMPEPAPVTTATLPANRRPVNELMAASAASCSAPALAQGDPLDRTHAVAPCLSASARNRLAQVCFRILPAGLRGTDVDQLELLGDGLDPEALVLQVRDHVVEARRLWPSLTATTAQARSPVFGSGRPMTATSATAGWA